MATGSLNVAAAAFEYASYGWKVVPLLARDKRPRINNWQNDASSDEETISSWFESWPDSNVGVRMGEASGIIDVECDDEAAEELLLKLFDNDVPVTPTFSAVRGKHRLFRWRIDLPEPGKAVFKIGKLEFRTGNGRKGAQSVFPPSTHPTGAPYKWLVHPGESSVAEFSQAAFARLWNWCGEETPLFDSAKERKPQDHWDRIVKGVSEGGRNEDAASLAGKVLLGIADPFDNDQVSVYWKLLEGWNRLNRPPMPEEELRATFDSILSRERRRRTDETYQKEFSKEARPTIGEDRTNDGWKLVILDSKPQVYELYSPLWHDHLDLDSNSILSPKGIRLAALEQRSVWVPQSFDKVWTGTRDTPSLGRQLIESAEVRTAPLEIHRDKVVAALLLEQLRTAKPLGDGQKLDHRGRPTLMEDGSVLFLFATVWKELAYGPDKVLRSELSLILNLCGAKFTESNNRKYKVVDKDGLVKLGNMCAERPLGLGR